MKRGISHTEVAGGINAAVKDELRSTGWPVYEHYEIREESGEMFVIAPLFEGRRKKDEKNTLMRPFNPFDPMEDVKEWRAPLRTPELLLDLAELADRPITPESVVVWANDYGLLACSREEDTLGGVSGFGRRESVARFVEAAGEIRACLRIYEALAKEEDWDFNEIYQYTFSLPRDLVAKANLLKGRLHGEERSAFYDVVAMTIQRRLLEHCYPQLTTFTRSGKPSGRFGFNYGFHSLLGAVWLQLAWLLSSEEQPVRCKLPTCRRVISFELGEAAEDPGLKKNVHGKHKTRSDREFCKGRACKQKYHYRKKVGWPDYV